MCMKITYTKVLLTTAYERSVVDSVNEISVEVYIKRSRKA